MKLICVSIICLNTICLMSSSPVSQREGKALDKRCTKDALSVANTCADKLWFVGRKSRKYPETDGQLQKHCRETSELITCVKDFTDMCGNEIQRQLAKVMLYTMRTVDKIYCTKNNKKQEFMSLGHCGNVIRDESSKCMDDFLLMLGKSTAYETKLKVPHACCSFHTMKACILKSAQESGQCSDKSIDNFDKYMNSLSGNTINLMCNEYEEESDKCQHLPSLPRGVRYSRALNIIQGFAKILEETNTKVY